MVLVGGVDLLNCVEDFSLEVEALPDFREPSPAQLFAAQVALDEGLVLEDGVVVCSFEDGLLLAQGIGGGGEGLFVSLCLVAHASLFRFGFAFSGDSAYGFVGDFIL